MITESKTMINLTIVQLNVVYSPSVGLAIANDLTTASNQQESPWIIFVLPTCASTSHPTILIVFFLGTGSIGSASQIADI